MCEDLEKQYNELLPEYRKCVEKKMAPEDYQQSHSLGTEGIGIGRGTNEQTLGGNNGDARPLPCL